MCGARRFFSALGEAALSLDSVAPRANPELRLRCAAQLACALSEHGGRNAAAELFDGEAAETGSQILITNLSGINRSLSAVDQFICGNTAGDRMNRSGTSRTRMTGEHYGNLRAIATVQCLAFAKNA